MAARDLFLKAKEGLPRAIAGFGANTPFELPIIEDMEGNTPIDVAMGLAESTKWKFKFGKSAAKANL